ncbi:hypothetical protein [Komarekiella delphini-convector]|uniref:hypothetical protein n=1 Tax=Komarekiella delphini-convector TaxID=3050158 RepID=UPI00177BBBBD|nr:hypothetical protein [Komarekiella delphini-convector]
MSLSAFLPSPLSPSSLKIFVTYPKQKMASYDQLSGLPANKAGAWGKIHSTIAQG